MGAELVAYLRGFGTKTYLHIEEGELICVNGYIEKHRDTYMITSFAAYPKKYIFEDMNMEIKSKKNEVLSKITLEKKVDGKYILIDKKVDCLGIESRK